MITNLLPGNTDKQSLEKNKLLGFRPLLNTNV